MMLIEAVIFIFKLMSYEGDWIVFLFNHDHVFEYQTIILNFYALIICDSLSYRFMSLVFN